MKHGGRLKVRPVSRAGAWHLACTGMGQPLLSAHEETRFARCGRVFSFQGEGSGVVVEMRSGGQRACFESPATRAHTRPDFPRDFRLEAAASPDGRWAEAGVEMRRRMPWRSPRA